MKPVTREEQYLNRLTGEEQEIPEEPVTREEQYLARLCGQTNSIPEKPVTRREEYLANLCGEDVIIPEEQVTRMEQYMAFAAGARETKPEEPVTREEWYWDKYQGGDVPEEKTIPFTDIITVTDALARPAVDLQSEITATQNLNGYEYPWVGGAGKNLCSNDASLHIGVTNSPFTSGVFISLPNYCDTYYIPTTTSANLAVSCDGSKINDALIRVAYCNDVPMVGGAEYRVANLRTNTSIAVDTSYTYIVFIFLWNNVADKSLIQIEKGTTCTQFEPYENICPISGRTEVNVTRTGKNLLIPRPRPETVVNGIKYTANDDGSISISGTATSDADLIISTAGTNPIIVPVGNYTFSTDGLVSGMKFIVSGGSRNRFPYREMTVNSTSGTGTVSDSSKPFEYIMFRVLNGTTVNTVVHPQLELGSTATAYESYEGDTFNTELGRTVYGGTLDLTTGELTITHAYEDLYSRDWLYSPRHNVFTKDLANRKSGATNFITTNYRTVDKNDVDELLNGEITGAWSPKSITIKDERATTVADFIALLTDAKICYELAAPQTISLTPTEVMMLENNNTIWADSGRVQLTYLSKAAQRVQTMNASLQANALKLSGLKKTTEEGGTTK